MRNACSCNSIREGAGGVSYSYAILGVLCPDCEYEAQMEYEQLLWEERRAAMTQAERDAEDIAARWSEALRRLRRVGYPQPGVFSPVRQPGDPLRPGAWRRSYAANVWGEEPPF